jgi:starch synthase
VLLEAMSCGVPVVASRISGFRLLMKDGVHGLLVDPPTDETRFVAALDRLLDRPDEAARMGAAGRAHAVDTYSWPAVAGELERLYERLLATAPG